MSVPGVVWAVAGFVGGAVVGAGVMAAVGRGPAGAVATPATAPAAAAAAEAPADLMAMAEDAPPRRVLRSIDDVQQALAWARQAKPGTGSGPVVDGAAAELLRLRRALIGLPVVVAGLPGRDGADRMASWFGPRPLLHGVSVRMTMTFGADRTIEMHGTEGVDRTVAVVEDVEIRPGRDGRMGVVLICRHGQVIARGK